MDVVAIMNAKKNGFSPDKNVVYLLHLMLNVNLV
jgi:hypothetical protein